MGLLTKVLEFSIFPIFSSWIIKLIMILILWFFWFKFEAMAEPEFGGDDLKFAVKEGEQAEDHLDGEKGGPTGLNKLGSSSTAELHPNAAGAAGVKHMPPASVMTRLILIMVWRKLIRNPNTYSSLIGVIWSLVAFR